MLRGWGAIFTNDDALATKLRIILNHGQTKRYVHSHIGINGRLDAIQSGVLNVKLKYYDEELLKREEIAQKYNNELKNVTTPYIEKESSSVWAQYCILVENRDEILNKCSSKNVPTGVYYPIPLHLQEVFEYLGHEKGDFPVTEELSEKIMALPMSAFLTKEEQDYIIEVINE